MENLVAFLRFTKKTAIGGNIQQSINYKSCHTLSQGTSIPPSLKLTNDWKYNMKETQTNFILYNCLNILLKNTSLASQHISTVWAQPRLESKHQVPITTSINYIRGNKRNGHFQFLWKYGRRDRQKKAWIVMDISFDVNANAGTTLFWARNPWAYLSQNTCTH